MKQTEFNNIMYALDDVENREKAFCKKFCELNPDSKKRREADMHLYLLAISMARAEIKKAIRID